jgi:hypothetical protein
MQFNVMTGHLILKIMNVRIIYSFEVMSDNYNVIRTYVPMPDTHVIKVEESGGKAPFIINTGARLTSVIIFTPLKGHSLDRRLGGPQSQS